jgi:hypothetical protein
MKKMKKTIESFKADELESRLEFKAWGWVPDPCDPLFGGGCPVEA